MNIFILHCVSKTFIAYNRHIIIKDKYTYIKRRAHIKKITFGFLRKKLLLSLYITSITGCYYMAGFEMHFSFVE